MIIIIIVVVVMIVIIVILVIARHSSPREAYSTGMLRVDGIHELYFEDRECNIIDRNITSHSIILVSPLVCVSNVCGLVGIVT